MVWTASEHQHQSPPQEYRRQNSHDNKKIADSSTEPSAAIQIDCDPECTAKHSNDNGQRGIIGRFFNKAIEDPLTVATILLVLVVTVQVRDARHSSERQLRAYVLMKTAMFHRPDTEDGDNREWPIHLVFQNSGQTPAYAVAIKAESHIGLRKPIDSIFPLSESAEISPPSIMAPGARHTMRLGGIEPGHASYLRAQKTEQYCYVWGRLDYIDTFGRKHFTKFQMWQGFEGVHQFGFCQVGNGTDDEFSEGWRQKLIGWMRMRKFS